MYTCHQMYSPGAVEFGQHRHHGLPIYHLALSYVTMGQQVGLMRGCILSTLLPTRLHSGAVPWRYLQQMLSLCNRLYLTSHSL